MTDYTVGYYRATGALLLPNCTPQLVLSMPSRLRMRKEEQHMAVRLAILNHMASEHVVPLLLRGHLHGYASIAEYTTAKNMNKDDSWGTDVEMLALAHMLHTTVYAYVSQHGT